MGKLEGKIAIVTGSGKGIGQTENRLPTLSKLLLINTEELIFSLTMQADTQKRSTKISNIRQLRSGNGQKNSGIRSSKQT